MKIAVTGGAGFIASQIADAYVAAGHEVIVIDDLSTRQAHQRAAGRQVLPRRHPHARRCAEIFRSERPQVLSHHAAQLDVRRSVADPAFDADVNLLGTLNLLEAAREVGVERVLFASSGGAVYGEQPDFPAPESHPHDPLSPYGITKATGEHYLSFYHAVHGMPYVALRYSNVYGPRQDPHGEAGVVAIFTERLLAGEAPTINGDGKQTRDYVFVGDVVRANLAALEIRLRRRREHRHGRRDRRQRRSTRTCASSPVARIRRSTRPHALASSSAAWSRSIARARCSDGAPRCRSRKGCAARSSSSARAAARSPGARGQAEIARSSSSDSTRKLVAQLRIMNRP